MPAEETLAVYAIGRETAKQAPTLAVMAWLVFAFLRHLGKRDDVLKGIGDRWHEVQRDSTKAIQENTRMLGKVDEALNRLNGRR